MKEVYIINESPFELPSYATVDSAGVDLKAFLDKPLELKPLERKIIRTGIKLALPEGFEAQVRPRSGLAAKHGISILNSPGTIDSDYRGEIGVILVNLSNKKFTVNSEMMNLVGCSKENFYKLMVYMNYKKDKEVDTYVFIGEKKKKEKIIRFDKKENPFNKLLSLNIK